MCILTYASRTGVRSRSRNVRRGTEVNDRQGHALVLLKHGSQCLLQHGKVFLVNTTRIAPGPIQLCRHRRDKSELNTSACSDLRGRRPETTLMSTCGELCMAF